MSNKAFDDATAYPGATPVFVSPNVVEWYYEDDTWKTRPDPWTGSRTATYLNAGWLFAHQKGDLVPWNVVVYQDEDWREAEGEDVEGADPKGNDRQCAVHVHPLTSTDLSGLPQWGPMVTLAHAGTLNLNDPASAAARPSDWAGGAGVTVNPADNDEWTVADGTANPQVTRTLASRYPLRMTRLNDRGAAGIAAEYLADWMIMHKANIAIDTTGDDPDWWDPAKGGVLYEDHRDLDGVKYLAVTITAPRSGTVTLRLQHDVWAHASPYYTCWQHTFGPDGEHVSGNTAHELTWEFEVVAGAASYLLDIVRNEQRVIPREDTAIKHAMTWRFTLPGNDSGAPEVWDLGGFVARLDPGEGERAEPSNHVAVRFKRAWDWLTCWLGFGGVVDGCEAFSGLNYGYLSSFGYTREEVGLLYIHARQHCPESVLTDDLHYAKALSRLADELNWQEGWTATYHTPEEAAENEDADGEQYASTLYWWDLQHCHEWDDDDLVMDGALTVGQTTVLGGLPDQEVYFSVYPRGRVHGLSMSDDWERQRHAVDIHIEGDDGDGYEVLEAVSADEHGRFRPSPVREKDWQYRVGDIEGLTVANREYTWAVVSVLSLWDPYLERDAHGTLWRVAESEGVIHCHRADFARATIGWRRMTAPFGETADLARPSIAACKAGSLIAAATEAEADMVFARSRDLGTTWTALASADIGAGLAMGTLEFVDGEVFVCGYSGKEGAIILRATSDETLARMAFAGGATELVVCEILVGNEGTPRSFVTVGKAGEIIVGVDDLSGAGLAYYRLRNHIDGFAAIAAADIGADIITGTGSYRDGEHIIAGYHDGAVLFRASTQETLERDDLYGATDTLQVCAAALGDEAAKAMALAAGGAALVEVGHDGTMRTYRCRSFTGGFERADG